jgi:hypothetical protein
MIIEKQARTPVMDQERWQRITGLFHEALECEPEARGAFLDGACNGDTDLRRQVELLLSQAEQMAADQRMSLMLHTKSRPFVERVIASKCARALRMLVHATCQAFGRLAGMNLNA